MSMKIDLLCYSSCLMTTLFRHKSQNNNKTRLNDDDDDEQKVQILQNKMLC